MQKSTWVQFTSFFLFLIIREQRCKYINLPSHLVQPLLCWSPSAYVKSTKNSSDTELTIYVSTDFLHLKKQKKILNSIMKSHFCVRGHCLLLWLLRMPQIVMTSLYIHPISGHKCNNIRYVTGPPLTLLFLPIPRGRESSQKKAD